MKPIYKSVAMASVMLAVSLQLSAELNNAGDITSQKVQAESLQGLSVKLVSPNVSGAKDLIASGDCVLANEYINVNLSGLAQGTHRLTVSAEYGTQTVVLYALDIVVPAKLAEGEQEFEDTIVAVSTYADGDDSGADASVYAKDGDGNAHITKPLNVSGSVSEGSPYGVGVYTLDVVVLTPEQKAEVEAETGTAYDYCDKNDSIPDGANVTIYADEECTQKVGSTSKTEYVDGDVFVGDFFDLQIGESILAGTYYARIERTLGANSHAEGSGTTASGSNSHAEGTNTTASGENSHAEGSDTTASGESSHAEGRITTASGEKSHAEGSGTIASGFYSHAEGSDTTASGQNSHAEGLGTIASQDNQHVSGKFNVEDTNGDYILIVGNGKADDARSNAFAIDWHGNLVLFDDGTPVVLLPDKLAQLIA